MLEIDTLFTLMMTPVLCLLVTSFIVSVFEKTESDEL